MRTQDIIITSKFSMKGLRFEIDLAGVNLQLYGTGTPM
jgi:hypothetical protein